MFFRRERFERKLAGFEERLEKLERDMRALELDWESTYDKVRHTLQRVAKRAEALHDEAETKGELHPLDPGERATLERGGHLLTPRQMALQRQIMSRRKSNGGETA